VMQSARPRIEERGPDWWIGPTTGRKVCACRVQAVRAPVKKWTIREMTANTSNR
jgi:hypothetical protein